MLLSIHFVDAAAGGLGAKTRVFLWHFVTESSCNGKFHFEQEAKALSKDLAADCQHCL